MRPTGAGGRYVLAFVLGGASLAAVNACFAAMGIPAREDKEASEQLARGQRNVIGTVLAISGDQIKVDVGELQPRFLPLKPAKQKSFGRINEGDELIITLNEQNLIVDFHLITDATADTAGQHKIIRGAIAQALVTGQESVVIRSDGNEESFPIRSQVRSKVAAVPIEVPAVFFNRRDQPGRRCSMETEGRRQR